MKTLFSLLAFAYLAVVSSVYGQSNQESKNKLIPDEGEVLVNYLVQDFNKVPEVGASIRIETSKGVKIEGVSDQDGKFTCIIKGGENCKILVRQYHQVFNFTSEIPNQVKTKEMDQVLQITVTNKYMRTYNLGITFEKGTDTYSDEASFMALYKLLTDINQSKETRLEIASFVYTQGSPEENLRLSQKRSQKIYDYLKMNGALEYSYRAKGHGETEPDRLFYTDEDKLKAERVEIRVIFE